MSQPLELLFNEVLGAYNALWKIGGLVATDPAIGNRDDWLGCYRSGLRGMLARLLAVDRHVALLHRCQKQAEAEGADVNPNEWAVECEYRAGQIFFGMDSSLECFVFAMNALGSAKDPSKFRDVSKEKPLKDIGPVNILGAPQKKPQPGYQEYFPRVKDHREKNRQLISRIMEYHNVSKHRSAIATDGRVGVLHLRDDPKQPGPRGSSSVHTLESIAHEYRQFMDELLPIALKAIGTVFGFPLTRRDLGSSSGP